MEDYFQEAALSIAVNIFRLAPSIKVNAFQPAQSMISISAPCYWQASVGGNLH